MEQSATIPYNFTAVFESLFRYLLTPPLHAKDLVPRDPISMRASHSIPDINKTKCILINGAAGPQGMWAVQLACRVGAAHITATCKAADIEYVRKLGAHEVLDCDTSPGNLVGWTRRKFDRAFDCIGGPGLAGIYRVIHRHGRIVSTMEKPSSYKPFDCEPYIFEAYCVPVPHIRPLTWLTYTLNRGLLRPPKWDAANVFQWDQWDDAKARLSTLGPSGQVVVRFCTKSPTALIKAMEELGSDEDGEHELDISPPREPSPPESVPEDKDGEHGVDTTLSGPPSPPESIPESETFETVLAEALEAGCTSREGTPAEEEMPMRAGTPAPTNAGRLTPAGPDTLVRMTANTLVSMAAGRPMRAGTPMGRGTPPVPTEVGILKPKWAATRKQKLPTSPPESPPEIPPNSPPKSPPGRSHEEGGLGDTDVEMEDKEGGLFSDGDDEDDDAYETLDPDEAAEMILSEVGLAAEFGFMLQANIFNRLEASLKITLPPDELGRPQDPLPPADAEFYPLLDLLLERGVLDVFTPMPDLDTEHQPEGSSDESYYMCNDDDTRNYMNMLGLHAQDGSSILDIPYDSADDELPAGKRLFSKAHMAIDVMTGPGSEWRAKSVEEGKPPKGLPLAPLPEPPVMSGALPAGTPLKPVSEVLPPDHPVLWRSWSPASRADFIPDNPEGDTSPSAGGNASGGGDASGGGEGSELVRAGAIRERERSLSSSGDEIEEENADIQAEVEKSTDAVFENFQEELNSSILTAFNVFMEDLNIDVPCYSEMNYIIAKGFFDTFAIGDEMSRNIPLPVPRQFTEETDILHVHAPLVPTPWKKVPPEEVIQGLADSVQKENEAALSGLTDAERDENELAMVLFKMQQDSAIVPADQERMEDPDKVTTDTDDMCNDIYDEIYGESSKKFDFTEAVAEAASLSGISKDGDHVPNEPTPDEPTKPHLSCVSDVDMFDVTEWIDLGTLDDVYDTPAVPVAREAVPKAREGDNPPHRDGDPASRPGFDVRAAAMAREAKNILRSVGALPPVGTGAVSEARTTLLTGRTPLPTSRNPLPSLRAPLPTARKPSPQPSAAVSDGRKASPSGNSSTKGLLPADKRAAKPRARTRLSEVYNAGDPQGSEGLQSDFTSLTKILGDMASVIEAQLPSLRVDLKAAQECTQKIQEKVDHVIHTAEELAKTRMGLIQELLKEQNYLFIQLERAREEMEEIRMN